MPHNNCPEIYVLDGFELFLEVVKDYYTPYWTDINENGVHIHFYNWNFTYGRDWAFMVWHGLEGCLDTSGLETYFADVLNESEFKDGFNTEVIDWKAPLYIKAFNFDKMKVSR